MLLDVGLVALIVLVALAVLVHRSARQVPAAVHWLRTAGLLVMVGHAGLWFLLGIGLMLSGHVAGAWHAVPGTVALALGVGRGRGDVRQPHARRQGVSVLPATRR